MLGRLFLLNRTSMFPMRAYKNTVKASHVFRQLEYQPFACNTIYDNPGAVQKKRIKGRGNASTKGKTAGRGQKGQRARSGGHIHPAFTVARQNFILRKPKFGFNNKRFAKPFEIVAIDKIIYMVRKKKLDPTQPITIKHMYDCGIFKRIEYGVKVLARGVHKLDTLKHPLHLEVNDASQAAIDGVNESGGSIKIVYLGSTLKRFLMPHKFHVADVKIPMPPPKQVIKLEAMKEKGVEVEYPEAPWFEEYKAA